jgi:hypothetical protein
MKLKEYIKQEILKGTHDFVIPLNEKGDFDEKGLSKVEFSVEVVTPQNNTSVYIAK